jgi:hypothetical protein
MTALLWFLYRRHHSTRDYYGTGIATEMAEVATIA